MTAPIDRTQNHMQWFGAELDKIERDADTAVAAFCDAWDGAVRQLERTLESERWYRHIASQARGTMHEFALLAISLAAVGGASFIALLAAERITLRVGGAAGAVSRARRLTGGARGNAYKVLLDKAVQDAPVDLTRQVQVLQDIVKAAVTDTAGIAIDAAADRAGTPSVTIGAEIVRDDGQDGGTAGPAQLFVRGGLRRALRRKLDNRLGAARSVRQAVVDSLNHGVRYDNTLLRTALEQWAIALRTSLASKDRLKPQAQMQRALEKLLWAFWIRTRDPNARIAGKPVFALPTDVAERPEGPLARRLIDLGALEIPDSGDRYIGGGNRGELLEKMREARQDRRRHMFLGLARWAEEFPFAERYRHERSVLRRPPP